MTLRALTLGLGLTLAASAGLADSWTLDGAGSQLNFGSIKATDVGEVHGFDGLSGTVTEDGAVTVGIDLASVDTAIDIRNERMIEHVFKGATTATLSAQMDMAALEGMAVGAGETMTVEGDLSFLGVEVPIDADMYVLRLSEDRVMVSTDSMIFISTAEVEIDGGIDTLKGLAGLDHIGRAVPVTMRLMFDADGASG